MQVQVQVQVVLAKLREVRIFQVCELALWLACSIPTARRRLRAWAAHTSVNCNGRYYTLPDVPRFDRNGLWRYQEALFSRHGNLKETVRALVGASPAGLTSAEIGAILGVDARAFLSHFRADAGLSQHRDGRRDVWLSGDAAVRGRQLEARRCSPEAVRILVEVIRHPRDDVDQIAAHLRAGGEPVPVPRIRSLLEYHGLAKGGALDSEPSRR
jgi:hypothetical protein